MPLMNSIAALESNAGFQSDGMRERQRRQGNYKKGFHVPPWGLSTDEGFFN